MFSVPGKWPHHSLTSKVHILVDLRNSYRGKLRILNHIISFVQHGNAGTTLVEVFSNDQERFAHEVR